MKIIFLLLLMNTAYAETFKIVGESHKFADKDGLLVYGCEEKCDALSTVAKHKKINLKQARKSKKYIGSVGSDTCQLIYKAKSILGRAENKDGRAFCVFKDKSMVETNSLTEYLMSKNIVSE